MRRETSVSYTHLFQNARVKEEYDWVTGELDRLLRRHGYVRNGLFYRAVAPNEDTIVLFCHFGVECVLLSHLLNISPMQLWHGTCAAPSSVTVLYTEAVSYTHLVVQNRHQWR